MKKKEIVKCILLSFVTCGIYGIIWFIELTNDAAKLNDDNNFNGGTALLLTIVTCGIYGVYWNYKMGKEIYEAGIKRNKNVSDQSILYLVLSLVGLGIVNYCLMQNDINNLITNEV